MKREARVFGIASLDEFVIGLFRFVNKTIAIECDKNGLDGMCHLGVSQLSVYQIQFSVRDG